MKPWKSLMPVTVVRILWELNFNHPWRDESYSLFTILFIITARKPVGSCILLTQMVSLTFLAPRFFSGNSFLSLRTPYDLQGDRTELVFYIRPMMGEGVLLYTDSEKSGDFLGLALKDGHLIYRLVYFKTD